MIQVIRIFLSTPGRAKWTVLLSVLLASIAEGIGLAGLLPALSVLVDPEAGQGSQLSLMVFRVLNALGLPANLGVLVIVVFLAILLKAALIILAMRHVGFAVAEVATRLRKNLVRSVLAMNWSGFIEQSQGRIANAISVDSTRSAEAYRLATMFVAAGLQSLVYLSLSLLISWEFALLCIGVGLSISLVLRPLVRSARKAGAKQRQRTEDVVTLMTDVLGNIKPIKAMARQADVIGFIDKKLWSLRKGIRKETVARQLLKNLREPMLMVFLIGGLYLAKTYLNVPVAEMIIMAMLLQKTAKSIGRVQEQLQNAAIVECSWQAVQQLIDEAHGIAEHRGGDLQPSLERGCRLSQVSFEFGDQCILDRVSMDIPANSLTVITGASGAGKTTIIDLILGLHTPQQGEVLIDDVPLKRIDLAAWRGMIGYVPQELTLFHDTILANLTMGATAISTEAAEDALRAAGAWEFVSRLPEGLQTHVGERGLKLSGGQRQRISLARALLGRSRLLILDEVTSALDPVAEAEICRNVLELARERTVIAITHKTLWTEAAQQVWHLEHGAVRLVSPVSP